MVSDQQIIAEHFDVVAKDYDYWKKKNWYYYDALRTIARTYAKGRVLDVGYGTGALIEAVAPHEALGIDISPEMVAVARTRASAHPEYRFETADITRFRAERPFETILYFDVVEHVPDTETSLRSLHGALLPGGNLVVTMANPLWEPILMLAEKFALKMPEGPHYRVPVPQFLQKARAAGLTLRKRDWYLLFPKSIPVFSRFINEFIGRLPLLRRLCVIEIFVFTRV